MFSNELWQKSGVSTYSIDQSIRFNKADSAYLKKTFGSSASNRRTHTYSFWVKLGANAAGINANGGCFFLSTNDTGANAGDYLHLNGSLELRYWSNNSSAETFKTNQVFRDYSAWYHILLVNDRDNSVGSEAVRLYVNGQRVTSFAVDNISGRKSQDTMVNGSSYFWQIQRFTSGDVNGDCYMADIVFIDGQALGPSSFGEYSDDGIWRPVDVSDLTFGTNGFYIDGRDSSDLGDDESGQGNDFTASGLAAHDQVLDSPTNNFNTLNPLYETTAVNLSEGNLEGEGSNTSYRRIVGTQAVTSGKWYFEGYIIKTTVNNPTFGWVLTEPEDWDNYAQPGTGAHEAAVMAAATGQTHVGKAYVNNNLSSAYTSTTAAGDIFGIAIDFDNLGFYIHKNGTYYNSGDPTSGSNKTGSLDASGLEANTYTPALGCQDSNSAAFLNFGQDGTFGGAITAGGNSDANGIGNFKYSVPSGYKALCTKNLGR